VRIAALLRSTRWTLPAAGLAAALLAAVPALAHETWKEPGHVYLRAGVNAEYVNLPEVEAFIDGGLETVGQTDDTFWAEGLHAVLGFVDGSGMNLPDPIGQNARIEARVTYLHGDGDATETDLASAGFFVVDDPGLAVLAIVPVDALYESDLESWEADLLYQTDVPLCDRVVFSPLVGFTYTRLDLDNEFKTAAGGLLLPLSVKDDLTTDYYGLALGGDLVARPVDFLEIRLGVRGDLMGDADFRVDQQLGFATIDESDDDVDFAARATTSLGVTLRIRRLELGVEGYARYLSYLPVAEHPVSSSDSPSRIDDEDLWGMGWKARIGFWF
jgi:hypothetical protein